MSYENVFGDDAPKPGDAGVVVLTDADQVVVPPLDTIEAAGNGAGPVSTAEVAGVLGILGGLAIFAILLPFGVGAIAGAVVAPEGRRKAAAKSGAWVGGIGGFVAYPLLYGVTGSSSFATRMAGIAPMVLGGYMGYREREK